MHVVGLTAQGYFNLTLFFSAGIIEGYAKEKPPFYCGKVGVQNFLSLPRVFSVISINRANAHWVISSTDYTSEFCSVFGAIVPRSSCSFRFAVANFPFVNGRSHFKDA